MDSFIQFRSQGDAFEAAVSDVLDVFAESAVCLESRLNGELNARLVECNDAPVAFADKEFMALKRVELRQPKLAVELFVQHNEAGDGRARFSQCS
jgi:hypothetical protein